jgi:hypothetical protein
MLMAVVASVFVSCNSPESRMKKIMKLSMEQDALKSEYDWLEIEAIIDMDVKEFATCDEYLDEVEEDAELLCKKELLELEREIEKCEKRVDKLSDKIKERYYKLEYE